MTDDHPSPRASSRARRAIAIGAALAVVLAAVIVRDVRAKRRAAEIERQRTAIRAALDENAGRLRELRGSHFATDRQRQEKLAKERTASPD